MKIYKFLFLIPLFSSLFIVSDSFAEEAKYRPSGPLNIRNQMPTYIFYMAPYPDKAQTINKGKTKIDVSYHVSNNIILQHPVWQSQVFPPAAATRPDSVKYQEWYIYLDAEVSRFDLNLSYGLSDNLQLSIDIPYYIFDDGYLDGFIEGFEDAFSFIKTPNAREDAQRNAYGYEIRNKGKTIVLDPEQPNNLGEVSAYLKYRVLNEGQFMPATSVRAAIKFPTTSEELLGSKKFDYNLGILFDKRIFKRLFLYSNVNLILIEKPDIFEQLDVFSCMLHGILGIEFFLTDKTSMLFQATANTTVYDAGVPATKHDPVVLTLGFNHNFNDKISWQIAIDENTNSAAPDFGIFTSLKYKL